MDEKDFDVSNKFICLEAECAVKTQFFVSPLK